MKAKIELQWQKRAGQDTPEHASKAEQLYLDYLVNGRSLRDWLSLETEHIGILGWQNPKLDKAALNQICLLQDSERVGLYACPECADIGCGMITVAIQDKGQRIVWENFAYENGYEPMDETEYLGLSFEFDKNAYLNCFETYRASCPPSSRSAGPLPEVNTPYQDRQNL